MRLFAAALVSMSMALPVAAQDQSRTILVLDASGSMWGQIDGKTKIEIAQSVVGGLLDDLPEGQELGLTAYGHNRKGDCSDIETLVAPGANTREAIRNAVNAIKPKGKTPLSESVIRAAEALKYTENKATVILVSDGRETCDFDPCEVGKQLEATGVDFTAHVVGFDVANPADRAQLQCLAENTGGKFITAANASELTTALQEVAAPPEPVERDITFAAITEGTTQRIRENLVWSLYAEDGTALLEFEGAADVTRTLMEGTYRAEVLRTTDEANAAVTVTIDAQTASTVLLQLPEFVPTATLEAADEAEVIAQLPVTWTGPNDKGDLITVSEIGAGPTVRVKQVGLSEGSPVQLQMPADPGEYEIRYLWKGKVIAKRPITVTPVQATLTSADSGIAGSTMEVSWEGPGNNNDYISVAEIGSRQNSYSSYSYTRDGSTLGVVLPIEPGTYELRYVLASGPRVIGKKIIEVTPVEATVAAPAEAPAGASVTVEWDGPNYKNDYIAVAEIGAADNKYVNYTYTREGSPLSILMPAEPGNYEIRYMANQKSTILARQPISVVAVQASITAPANAAAGDSVVIEWAGPDYKNDYIAVAEVGQPDSKYINYTYTREGSPLRLKMPAEPGNYEIRYIQNQGSTVLARVPVTVEAVAAQLTFNETAAAGEPLLITWDGPDYKNDYISVAEIGAKGSKYYSYTYTRQGSPLRVVMPLDPGTYEVRYIQNQKSTVLASKTVTVEPVQVTLSAPDTAKTGEALVVQWEGPDYKNDFIAVAEVGQPANKYTNYTYTKQGAPLRLTMPPQPGEYEIRYIAQGRPDKILAARKVTVEPVEASMSLAGAAKSGETALIEWDGPDFKNDYIAISVVGDDGYETYARTSGGSPLRIKVPKQPGTYELRYVLGQKNTIISRETITVE
ncbi:MAG: VWA domain-containing protein [Pseudomonadota bacterium]